MAVRRYEVEKCTGCGVCIEYCTRDVWRLDAANGKVIIAYQEDCQSCYTCEINCPALAIWVHPYRYAPHMWPCDWEFGETQAPLDRNKPRSRRMESWKR